MKTLQYPALHTAADAASKRAQRTFLCLTVSQLIILTIIAFISGWSPPNPDSQRIVAIIVFTLMFIALGFTTALRIGHFDDKWFRARAFAENVKNAVWIFITSPMSETAQREKEYLRQLDQLRERLPELAKQLSLQAGGEGITHSMEEIQALALQEKLALYQQARLDDQLRWYYSKAAFNVRYENIWFVVLFIAEFMAVLYAAAQAWRLWELNAVGGISAACSGFIAWMQTKRYSDLGVSYRIAAEDLQRIKDKYKHVVSESEFADFIEEAEKAVSREHTLWLSRRI